MQVTLTNTMHFVAENLAPALSALKYSFYTVEYSEELADNGWCASAEKLAGVCKAPLRWLASDCFDRVYAMNDPSIKTLSKFIKYNESPKIYKLQHTFRIKLGDLFNDDGTSTGKKGIIGDVIFNEVAESSRKTMRVIAACFGLILITPFSIPLMAIAYLNPEIRQKYKSLDALDGHNDETKKNWKELNIKVKDRVEAPKAKDCEPTSCCLSSICSLLCYIVCCKD